MEKVSIIIPSRNEKYLSQTVADIFAKAAEDIEVIVVLDGYWPDPPLEDRKNLFLIHRGQAKGMRSGINSAAAIARGKYLMKCDAHCMFAEGFDEVLQADCEDNWIVVPRRLSLNVEEWKINPKKPVDYEHIFYPFTEGHEPGLHARPWFERGRERKDILLDENMSFQGSCWFMASKHFHENLGGMYNGGFMDGYGSFKSEAQEIGFKTYLGPWKGSIMTNKRTWYAHLHKGRIYGRMYSLSTQECVQSTAYSLDLWWNNKWTERVYDFGWLIDKFWPLPGWPDDWKDSYKPMCSLSEAGR